LDIETWIAVAFMAVSLVLLALASGAEAALTSINRRRLQHLKEENASHARIIDAILEEPETFLATILIVNTAATVTAAACATVVAIRFFPDWGSLAAIAALTIVGLMFGQIAPRIVAIGRPEQTALALGGFITVASSILKPFVDLLTALTRGVLAAFGRKNLPRSPFLTEEELSLLLNVGEEEGLIEDEEREMIHSIFEFGDTFVREVMVHRVDIAAVEAETPISGVIDVVLAEGHSRIPVYEDNIDNVIGVVYAKDLLRYSRDDAHRLTAREVARTPYFVPESKKVDELLHELQAKKVHMAIVVDEYGGTAGLVTIEDILEEIVGEIQDEYDSEPPLIEKLGEDEFVFDARASVDDVNELLLLDWHANDYDTVGGFVLEQLGKIPDEGDQAVLTNAVITVVSTDGPRLKKVKITRVAPADGREAHDDEATEK
jgi:putative hemolysin